MKKEKVKEKEEREIPFRWVTDLDTKEDKLNNFFFEIIKRAHNLSSLYELTKIEGDILNELKKYSHYEGTFFEHLRYSLNDYLKHPKTVKWKEKDSKDNRVVQMFQKKIQLKEDLLTWSKNQENKTDLSMENNERIKLKWLGKPEQFGFIFLELASKGYIEIPPTRGEASYAKYAKTCFELFDFPKNKTGKTTTIDNLERVLNPEKNKLSDTNRKMFKIPEMKDIS